jgi:hypothetical protein
MIIYGSRASLISTEIVHEKCFNCNTQGSMFIALYQKYAHIFWIPLFPIGKSGVAQCAQCKQVQQKENLTGNLLSAYQTAKLNTKAPWWTFSGLAIIGVLVLSGFYQSKITESKNAELILAPQAGDIYEIKKDNEYTLYKVNSVVKDTIYILPHQYVSNKISGLADLKMKGDTAYVQEPLPLLKASLKSKLETGEIINVNRN